MASQAICCINKDISFGDNIYVEPKNIQYKKLVNGVIDQLKVSLIDGDGNEILSDFKILIVLRGGHFRSKVIGMLVVFFRV